MKGIEWDPKTRTYTARISIGEKDPLPITKLKGALSRAMLGATGRLIKELERKAERELTDLLFWVEEGWI